MLFNQIYDALTGPCVRKISFMGASENALYLTFDDGPDPHCTPKVLELLKKYKAKATFFVIGLKARQNPGLIQQILKDGHTIGDHSLDHDTKNYFKDSAAISEWLEKSANNLKELKLYSIGFRSPVGIKTPGLNQALAKKSQPLILWSVRFFDTSIGLDIDAVERKQLTTGDIILLHDTHPEFRHVTFLKALEHLLKQSQAKGFSFLPLDEKIVSKSFMEKYETRE